MSDAKSHFFTIGVSDPQFEPAHIRHVTVKSPALGQRADITLFVPPGLADTDTATPIVILLHGVYGSHWEWIYRGGAHKTALNLIESGKIKPMILAMPSDGLWGDGSGYIPHANQDFEKWIAEDVFQAAIEVETAATVNSPVCIAGLSMGGYGALRIATKYPDRFVACSGLSSVTDFSQLKPVNEDQIAAYQNVNVPPAIIDQIIANRDRLPAIRFDCGKQDDFIESNRALHNALEERGIPHVYEEFNGGHEWPYWQTHLADTLLFFNEMLT